MAAKTVKPRLDAKHRILEYYNNNQVPQHIENLLNEMCVEKPDDIFGYMVNHFQELAKPPAIVKIEGCEVLSSHGYKTCRADLHCLINGLPKLVCSSTAPVDTKPPPENKPPSVTAPSKGAKSPGHHDKNKTPETSRTQTPDQEGMVGDKLSAVIDEMIHCISNEISPLLIGINPTDQKAVDAVLSNQQNVKEENHVEGIVPSDLQEAETLTDKDSSLASGQQQAKSDGPGIEESEGTVDNALLTVSMATAISGATLQNMPLYEHFAKIYRGDVPQSYVLPLPAMTLISNGKHTPGKQFLIKQLLVLPKPGESMKHGIQQLTSIYHELGKVLCSKVGISGGLIGKDGGYSPALDKPEIALECVQEAVEAAGYQMGENTNIIIICATDEIFDQEKQKYEIIVNTFKTGDDLINLYTELTERFPGLLAIIDGINSKDEDTWVKLNKKLGESCFISAQNFICLNPSSLSDGVSNNIFSMAEINVASSSTVSETVNKCQAIKEQGGAVMLEDAPGNSSSFLVDLAVGLGARFIKMGGAAGLEHVSKYNRLIDIATELEHYKRLSLQDKHVFPVINEPEPEEELPECEQENLQENTAP